MFFPNSNKCPNLKQIGANPLMLMSELKQRKIGIHTSLEDEIFPLYPEAENPTDYTVSGDTGVKLGENAEEFNNSGSTQILLNGRVLEKGVSVLYINQYCFRYMGITDQGDFFLILSP